MRRADERSEEGEFCFFRVQRDQFVERSENQCVERSENIRRLGRVKPDGSRLSCHGRECDERSESAAQQRLFRVAEGRTRIRSAAGFRRVDREYNNEAKRNSSRDVELAERGISSFLDEFANGTSRSGWPVTAFKDSLVLDQSKSRALAAHCHELKRESRGSSFEILEIKHGEWLPFIENDHVS